MGIKDALKLLAEIFAPELKEKKKELQDKADEKAKDFYRDFRKKRDSWLDKVKKWF